MKIKRKVQGHIIDLEIIKIKDYPRYGLYQVYKLENSVSVYHFIKRVIQIYK